MNVKSPQVLACGLALMISGCSSAGGTTPVPNMATHPSLSQTIELGQSPSLATYQFYCSNIGLGTITAVVVANSRGDAFHVTSVAGGNGTVSPGDMLLVVDYNPPNGKFQNHNPGFDQNGQTTYTCSSFSGRRNIFGTVTFVVRGAQSR